MRFICVFFTLLFVHSLLSGQAAPDPDILLKSPRRAVHTFLYYQLDGHEKPEIAAQSMGTELSKEERANRARKLLSVLDAKGLLIDYDAIPNEPLYRDSLSGLHQYILFDELPEVYLERYRGKWYFSDHTVESIPTLYQETFSRWVDFVVDRLPEPVKSQYLGLQLWQYAAIFIWILIGLVVKKIVEFVINTYIKRLSEHTAALWDDKIVYWSERPLGWIILSVFYYLTYANLHLGVEFNRFLKSVFEFLLLASVIWLIYSLINILDEYLQELTAKSKSKLDDQLVPLIRKTLKVLIVIVGTLFLLQNIGYNVASLLAGLGIGGLAFALAARETLENFFGSVAILIDRPFQIGDWVNMNGQDGIVEEVGFRSTRIRTFENSVLTIPNSKMANTNINNYGARQFRRFKAVLGLVYSTPPEQIEAFVEGIKAIIKASPATRKDYFEVHFNSFGDHSLNILIYMFFKVPDWSAELQARHNFLLQVLQLAHEIGVEFAFPTQTLHVDSFFKDQPKEVGKKYSAQELIKRLKEYGPDGAKARPDGLQLKDGEQTVNYRP